MIENVRINQSVNSNGLNPGNPINIGNSIDTGNPINTGNGTITGGAINTAKNQNVPNTNNPNTADTNNSMNLNSNGKTVSRLIKHDGKVIGYELSDGQLTSKEEGVQMAKDGQIDGVIVASRKDNEYLKSVPDQTESNNLSVLPSISVDEDRLS